MREEQAEFSVGVLTDKIISADSLKSEPHHCLLNCGSGISLSGLKSDASSMIYSRRFSCVRTITALAPVAYVGIGSYSTVKEISRNFIHGSMEEHIMSSLNLLIEGKPTGRDGANFLSLVGMPKFDENNIPGCVRHPNIAPVLGMLKTPGYINLLLPKTPYTLENILHYSPNALKSEWHIRFLIYQILSALAYIHGLGVSHGDICPASVLLNSQGWSWLTMCNRPGVSGKSNVMYREELSAISPSRLSCCSDECPRQHLYADLKISLSTDWQTHFMRWWSGDLSNYDYLLILNRIAGRRWGDHTFHPVMPWVIDFSMKPDEDSDAGWRDLGKSKWRLAKGDEQLEFTYTTSEIPHHISDECLSELAVCSYKARRLPLSVLRTAVRSVYEPNEYPSTMQRLYQWTPDECIPEFYSDPCIFSSLHLGMSDLAVPSWASSPEEFIKLHREALESSRVSHQIHQWIDITFGYKMLGQAAIAAKNVMLPSSDPMMPRSTGRRQLFTRPHPMRRVDIVGDLRVEKPRLSETTYLQELESAASFCEHASNLCPVYHSRQGNTVNNVNSVKEPPGELLHTEISKVSGNGSNYAESSDIDLASLVEYFEEDDSDSLGFPELLLWRQKLSCLSLHFEDVAEDIFSTGCIIAELYLKRPLFNQISLAAYLDNGVSPRLMQELPPHTAVLVEACIQRDWRRY